MMIPMTMEMATAVENPSSSILVLFPTSRKLTLQNYSQVWFTSIHNKKKLSIKTNIIKFFFTSEELIWFFLINVILLIPIHVSKYHLSF